MNTLQEEENDSQGGFKLTQGNKECQKTFFKYALNNCVSTKIHVEI
jgi:hypothetical protein